MRRLRGIAASARVHHSSRSTALQDLPAVAALGGAEAPAASEAGLAGNGLISSSSSESTSSPRKGGENGTSSSFPGFDESNIFYDDEEEQQARDLIRRWKETRSHLKIEKSELMRSVLLLLNVLVQIILTVVAVPHHTPAWDTRPTECVDTHLAQRIRTRTTAHALPHAHDRLGLSAGVRVGRGEDVERLARCSGHPCRHLCSHGLARYEHTLTRALALTTAHAGRVTRAHACVRTTCLPLVGLSQ